MMSDNVRLSISVFFPIPGIVCHPSFPAIFPILPIEFVIGHFIALPFGFSRFPALFLLAILLVRMLGGRFKKTPAMFAFLLFQNSLLENINRIGRLCRYSIRIN